MSLKPTLLPYLVALLVLLSGVHGFTTQKLPVRLKLSRQQRPFTVLHAKTRISMPHSNLAVSIDDPLLGSRPAIGVRFIQAAATLLTSRIFQAAFLAFLLACSLSLLGRFNGGLLEKLGNLVKTLQGQAFKLLDQFQTKVVGVPMEFSEEENDGWGVCTLRSKKGLGRTGFVQYDFDLPQPDNEIPLKLGQQISLCCLDQNDSVAKGDFYPYQPTVNKKLGTFSIITPNKPEEDNTLALGRDSAHFIKVLHEELKVGDEIALKPGVQKLEYRGQYFPVTDMVYIAVGTGIAPVLEQVRAVLPNGASSVKTVTVVWINENKDDFNVISEPLEREYMKYSTKLAVRCVVDDMEGGLGENEEISEAIPDFEEGTMAVVSAPSVLQRRASQYLITRRGYSTDCICEL